MISKKLKTLLLALALIAGVIVASGYFYYRSLNLAEDPRIIDARKKMAEYNELMSEDEKDLALVILDSVEDIYMRTPGYADSYERGVILNNRGSVFLIKAETEMIEDEKADKGNLVLAERYIIDGIDIYTRWLERIEPMGRGEIREMILPYFRADDPAFEGLDLEKIIEKRVDDIMDSKIETRRRLSVSHANLGIVRRYEGDLEGAKVQYERALELWPDNYVAEDNLHRLFGQEPEKRNLIQQMFFKDRDVSNENGAPGGT